MQSKTQIRTGLRWMAAITLFAATALASTAFAAQQQAPAQEQPPQAQQEAPGAQQQAVNPSEDKLESVAKAYVKVQAVQQEYGPKIQAAQKPEEAKQLENEANQQMEKAVNDAGGVTVNEYTQILQAAQQDQQLRARLIQHIHKQPGS
jgi:hypothetical protein